MSGRRFIGLLCALGNPPSHFRRHFKILHHQEVEDGPAAEGLGLFFVGLWLEKVRSREDAVIMAISVVIGAMVLAVVYWLNVRAANRLQRDLDLLPK